MSKMPLQDRRYRPGTVAGPLLLAIVALGAVGVVLSLATVPASGVPATAGSDAETPMPTPANRTAETPIPTPANRTAETSLYEAENATFDDARAVADAIEGGTLDPAETLSPGDALVVVIESPRLVASMDEHNGSTTDRFLAALDGEADLRIVQTNPTTMVSRTYARVGPANVTAHRDGSTVYAVLDTGDLVFRKATADNESRRVDSFREDRFAVDFGFDLYEPPWDPDDEGLFGPRFELTDEEYLTPTPTETTTPGTPTRTGSTTASAPERPTPSPTRAPSPPPTETAEPSAETTERPETTAGTATATGGPGFTATAALAAVAAVALARLARRHRR